MATMFNRGYEASRKEKERQDKQREEMGRKLFKFFLAEDGDEAELIFLTNSPVNFKEHNVKKIIKGNERYEQYTCTGDNCKLCAEGDTPTFKGAYLVIDRREYSYKKDGKTVKGKDQVKLFVYGTKVVSQLDRINTRYKGITNKVLNLIRLGKGTQTNYTVEKGDETVSLSEKKIKSLLPEKLRDDYDGTENSLYAILEEQLMMMAYDYDPDDADNDEEVYEDEDGDDSGIISLDDDEDDGEPDEPSPKVLLKGKKALFKKPQSSVKPSAGRKRLLKG